MSPKIYAIMGYAERSIRQLQSKFQKQGKIKRQQSVPSIFGTNSEAFKSICSLVDYQVITGGDVLGLKDAFNNYVSILEDLDADNLVASYSAQKLEEKLKLHFKKRINIHKSKYKRGSSLIYNSNITLEEALKLAELQKSKLHQRIKGVVLSVRATIKNATHTISL